MTFKSYKNGNEVIVVFQGPEDAIGVVTEVLKKMYGVETSTVPAIQPPAEIEDTPPVLDDENVVPLFMQEETEIPEAPVDEVVEETPTEEVIEKQEDVVENNVEEASAPDMGVDELRKIIFSKNKGKGNRIINDFLKSHSDSYENFYAFRASLSLEHASELYKQLVDEGVIK